MMEYTVLIVDDSTEDKTLYRYLLKRDPEFTYHFVEFDCGEDALNWCQYRTADVILLDYMLPDWDGLTVLCKLKQQIGDERPLPVIILTGEGDERIAVQAIKNGAQDYLVKDKLTSDLLCRTVHSVVEQVRLLEQVKQQQTQLQKLNAALEIKVQERTTELQAANDRLQQELLKQQLTQKLLEEQAKLLDLAHDGILTLDTMGVITFWNQGAERLYGWTRYEAAGKVANDLLQTQFSQPFAEIEATLTDQGFWEGEVTHLHRNGSPIQVSSRWVVRRNAIGKPIGILAINNDITERQKAKKALQDREQFLSSIYNAATEAIWVVEHLEDGDFLMVSMNGAIERLTQIPADWWVGKRISEMWDAETVLKIQMRYQQCLQQRETIVYEEDLPFATQVRSFFTTLTPLPDPHGRIRLLGISMDITDRKIAEAQLQQSEERLQLALEASGEGLWDWNIETGGVYRSSQYLEILGYATDELPDAFEAWEEKIHPEDRDEVLKQLDAHLQNHTVQFVCDYRVKTRSEGWKWISDYGKVVARDANGKPLRVIGTYKDISNRKRAEEVLKINEARWNFALAGNGDGVWDWDVQTNTVFFSRRWKEMLGFAEEEIGDCLSEWKNRIHPDDKARVYTELEKHFSGEIPQYVSEYRVLCKNRTYKWILNRGQVISRTEQGQPLRMIGTHTDITKRKQAEEALCHSEATKRAIIAAIPDLLIRMKIDGTYVDFLANNEFNLINPQQLRKDATVYNTLPDNLAQQRIYYAQQALQTEQNQTYEQQVLSEGQVRHEEVRIVPVEDDEVLIMVRDITDRKIAEAKLRQSEERLQLALEASGDGLWDWNITEGIVYLSPQHQEMLGYKPSELVVNLSVWENLIHPDDRTWVNDRLTAHLQDATIPYILDYRVKTKTGAWKWIANYGKIVAYDIAGKPIRMIGTHKDISERKQAELELQQAKETAEAANQAKSVFLANMSHELRTPLNVILGFTQILRRNSSLSSEYQEPIEIIHRSGEHLLNLINDVLDLSKIEAGRATSNESSFDVFVLLKTVKEMFNHRANSKGLEFHLLINPDVPQYITTDAEKLRQILLNLISNAIKFTEQGRVGLRVLCASDTLLAKTDRTLENIDKTTLLFEVEDTGAGIAAHETDIIFNAFAQSRVGKTTPGGTGLGLTISRHFIELMGGKISVHSVLGQGSLFRIYLPVQIAQSADLPTVELTRQLIGLAPDQPSYRILAVDDQPENRLLLVQLMSELGMEVQEAENGEEAVRLWQQWRPHLIWMDIQMPTVDGYGATQQIRVLEAQTALSGNMEQNLSQNIDQDSGRNDIQNFKYTSQNTVIIALTAHASKSDRALTFTAGCNDFVTKPFSENLLYDKMAKYLGLNFLYAERHPFSESDPLPIAPATSEMLTLQSLALMPLDWLTALHRAAQLCDEDDVKLLLQQIPETHASLSRQLNRLVHDYQFEQIKQLLQAAATSDETNI
jgi:PAS domain S-box-containing protein